MESIVVTLLSESRLTGEYQMVEMSKFSRRIHDDFHLAKRSQRNSLSLPPFLVLQCESRLPDDNSSIFLHRLLLATAKVKQRN
jgi:hypothetical protein